MKTDFLKTAFIFLLIITLSACVDEVDTNKPNMDLVEQKNIKVKIPKFEGKNAKAHVAKQVSFGPRIPNTEGHKACKEWLVSKFKSFGLKVIEQDFVATTYTNVKLNSTNIIARHNPNIKERVILAAHWDTRPFADKDPDPTRQQDPILGADDAGSGVGALLEIARLLKEYPIPMGVDIILFDSEDYGDASGTHEDSFGLGSQYWGQHPHLHRDDVKYGILLDMVGAKGAQFSKEGYSGSNAGELTNKIWKLAKLMKKDNLFVDQSGGFVMDDHFYFMKHFKKPMVDIINRPSENFGFGEYWHTHNDNMDIIDENVLEAVGQVVTAVIYKESNKEF